MPDTRHHRGAHPEDAALFARDQWPTLRRASGETWWLLDRGYAIRSTLALVGDRHALTQRQRLAIARSACAATDRDRRVAHHRPIRELQGAEVWIDGYNLLISLESALSGGVILFGRDGCYRDLASLHGTYRMVSETERAIGIIGESLATFGCWRCRWLLDRPVSNSGRLRELLLEIARARGWNWQVDLEFSPDTVLAKCSAIVATSDSIVLDRCAAWANLAREIIAGSIPSAYVVDLHDIAPIGG